MDGILKKAASSVLSFKKDVTKVSEQMLLDA